MSSSRAATDSPTGPGAEPAALRVDGLRRAFGGLTAVNGVSFAVAPGERRALIGPNGAGKTTLFNLISGELPPTAGHVYLAGAFAGLAGGLFGIFNRGVFPDFAYWTKSSEVLIMTLLGGMGTFLGPSIGALVLILLNQQIVSYTEYWPLVLGTILVLLLFVFPGGLAGAAQSLVRAMQRKRGPARA